MFIARAACPTTVRPIPLALMDLLIANVEPDSGAETLALRPQPQ